MNIEAQSGYSRKPIVLAAIMGIIACAVIRAAVATRLDSFTIDEPYHITAGVNYARRGDYRLNPEHPPLVKLWVAAFLPRSSFELPQLRSLTDKIDERHFAAHTVYLQNDPDLVQRRTRMAMLLLNSLLMLALSLSVWRVFNGAMAVGTAAFLMIDPSIAAHLPVVMTDLPVALLMTTSVLLAWAAFRWWRSRDLLLAGLALGLTLGAKHSAPVVMIVVAALAVAMAVWNRQRGHIASRLGQGAMVLALAWVVLWGFYRFRFNESPQGRDGFNRPLAEKVSDLNSGLSRNTMAAMATVHFLPRAYLWGLADTLRAGVEGRDFGIYFWDRLYIRKTPFYFFPAVLLVKMPIGLTVLSLVGLGFLLLNKVPRQWTAALGVVVGFAVFMLVVLASANSGYAGMRHALPVVPPLAVLGAVAMVRAAEGHSGMLSISIAVVSVAAIASAVPVMRPWEYYNELIGAKNAYRHFNDESLEVEQRTKELAAYYHGYLERKGVIPYVDYKLFDEEEYERRGVHSLQMLWKQDESLDTSDVVSGTLIVNAKWIAPDPWFDSSTLRAAEPAERFGNLLIYRGTFRMTQERAGRLFFRGIDAVYAQHPDSAKAEKLFREAVKLDPGAYFIYVELGNLLAQKGARDEATEAYKSALYYAPTGEKIMDVLKQQIDRISREDPKSVPPVRDPFLE